MLKKELASHFGLTLVWLLVLTVFNFDWRLNLIWFWLGGITGTFLLDLEKFLYRGPFLLNPQKSPFRNIIFQLILLAACFYVITSSTSFFGKGLVMAAALRLLTDELRGPQSFFWPLKAELNFYQRKLLVAVMFLVFLVLNLLLV